MQCTTAQTQSQENVESVVEHVRQMENKHSFKVDADCVRDAVEDSSELLRIELSEEDIALACSQLTSQG